MTRLERKQEQLNKLYQYRAAAMQNNDIMWLQMNQRRIDELEKEIAEMRKYEPKKLSDFLKDKPEDVKNDLYKALLRISLMADAVNEASFICKKKLKDLGIKDFTLRKEVDELTELSRKIASFVIIPNQKVLEDFIVDNDTFVDMCMEHADAHLKRKLKL